LPFGLSHRALEAFFFPIVHSGTLPLMTKINPTNNDVSKRALADSLYSVSEKSDFDLSTSLIVTATTRDQGSRGAALQPGPAPGDAGEGAK
jgi:hypothetical protein